MQINAQTIILYYNTQFSCFLYVLDLWQFSIEKSKYLKKMNLLFIIFQTIITNYNIIIFN